MGLSSKKTKQTTKPVYEAEIKGAHGVLSNTYNEQAPKIAGYADQIGELIPGLLDRYKEGDPAINAARGYVTDTINGDGSNPYLQDIIDQTNQSVSTGTNASLGTRGLAGGSVAAKIISKQLADNEGRLRYNDYDRNEERRARAAGMAPGIAAGDLMTLAPAFGAAELASGLPMDAATKYAAGTGGLLGQYTNSEQKQSGGLFGQILGAGLSGWASGGFG